MMSNKVEIRTKSSVMIDELIGKYIREKKEFGLRFDKDLKEYVLTYLHE